MHFFSFLCTLFREVNDGAVGGQAKCMKILEVAFTFVYLGLIISSTSLFFEVNLLGDFNKKMRYQIKEFNAVDHCTERKMLKQWGEEVEAWIMIEIIIYVSNLFTMMILMIKSRFMSVGVDQQDQFDPFYL